MNPNSSVSSTNVYEKSKIFTRASVSHARAELLLLRVTLDRERDQAIDQLRVRQPARVPHLRVHADRREPGDGVHFVQIEHLAVAGEQKVDARHAGAVDRLERPDRE